jgi:hypothetical protein
MGIAKIEELCSYTGATDDDYDSIKASFLLQRICGVKTHTSYGLPFSSSPPLSPV